ncbi:DNA replication complex GINS protein SLD5 isoform X2 [Punica granatum]|uniref:DNA replication complex GINS protein SLD5 n=2 Tax=Punica granatum TaxID=22663 RepID=A0A218WEX3_PUNGR|nr:DNA replication complex GINS protein SLD5 isoform X2 [Punica granatum]OWM71093.1 hypothetical protein CDL15_Pgr011220 [Punica granatum]PKI78250.1 hypothetical protein CRG98_001308 [Punica granatum]
MASGSSGPTEDLGTLTDVEPLKRAWRNEKAAPEILRYETHLIYRVSKQIELLEGTVDDFTEDGVDPLMISLYQMDLDRIQFLLRSYLRIRLQKIEKYMFHLLLKKQEFHEKLSKEEKAFVQRCAEDMKKHLDESVLSHLPKNYQSILKQFTTVEEDDAEVDDMVPEPPLDTFVVCIAREYVGPSEFQDSSDSLAMDLPLEMEPGDLSFIPYRRIKKLLESRKVDLV